MSGFVELYDSLALSPFSIDPGNYPTSDYQDAIMRYNRQRNDLLDGQMSETDPPPAAKSHGTYIHPLLTFTSP